MKKPNYNWEDVKEATEFNSPKPGGYICEIVMVEDNVEKEYLEIFYDFIEGEFKNYYRKLFDSQNFWGGKTIKSYKESAAPFFKGFTTAVERSNPPYKWDWDEHTLVGRKIGIVLQEEEYIPNQGKHKGELRTRLIVQECRSVDEIRKGNFKVKPKKLLADSDKKEKATQSQDKKYDIDLDKIDFGVTDDDIQF